MHVFSILFNQKKHIQFIGCHKHTLERLLLPFRVAYHVACRNRIESIHCKVESTLAHTLAHSYSRNSLNSTNKRNNRGQLCAWFRHIHIIFNYSKWRWHFFCLFFFFFFILVRISFHFNTVFFDYELFFTVVVVVVVVFIFSCIFNFFNSYFVSFITTSFQGFFFSSSFNSL